jgi:cytochrome bd-type quinol oxidase subunit 1
MPEAIVCTLDTTPQEGLRALQNEVAQRFDWRLLANTQDEQPRFVIEKRVNYPFVRGVNIYGLYQVIGDFDKAKSGDTTLRYTVSGQPGVPLVYAFMIMSMLLVFTLLITATVFSPPLRGNPIGVLLVFFMVGMLLVYGWYAYRRYQGHVRELHRFMEKFCEEHGS